jgi:hypothetical protein
MEVIVCILVVALFAALYSNLLSSRTNGLEKRFMMWGFAAHVAAAIAQVLVTKYVYGGGDMFAYFRYGTRLAELLTLDFQTYFPRVVELTLGGKPRFPFWVFGAGSSTGSMTGLSTFAMVLTNGSLYATCLLFGLFAYAGQVGLYLAFRPAFPAAYLRRRLLIACFLVPSVVFWSSGLLKEAVALGGLGIAVLGAAHFIRDKRRTMGIALVAVGCFPILLVKSYILLALAAAGALWYYWQRAERDTRIGMVSRPFYMIIGLLAAGAAIYYLGQVDERFAVGNIQEETAHLQRQYYTIGGGSTYVIGGDESGATAERQPWLAPIGLFSSLFRPMIFEIHNATSAVNAIEMTWVIIMLWTVVRTRRLKTTLRMAAGSPTIVFMVSFVLILGAGVGLAAPNLGSLSRYRIPMMPMWIGTLLLLLPRPRTRRSAEHSGEPQPVNNPSKNRS